MPVMRTTVRTSRKPRPCTGYLCPHVIKPGELYNEHVTGPGNPDLDNTRWIRLAECGDCAQERGHPIERGA